MMTMKKINKSDKVAGGSSGEKLVGGGVIQPYTLLEEDYINEHKGEHIGMYDMPGYVGQRFIISHDIHPEDCGEAILLKSYEKDLSCGTTMRMHEFQGDTGTFEIIGDDYTCYLYK